MRAGVLEVDRLRLIRTVAIVAVTALGAGCSADVARFDDGFYNGAVPKPQAAVGASQSYPGTLDQTATGSVNGGNRQPLYNNGGSLPLPPEREIANYPSSGVREGTVQRASLPLPPATPAASQPAPVRSTAYEDRASAAQLAPPTSEPRMSAASEGRTLGAPPQTLRAPSATRTATATPGHVVVERGDTLMGIARRSGVSVAELRAANGMTEDTVRLGQRLVLPGGAAEPRRVASLDPKAGVETRSVVKPAAKAVAETAAKQPKPYQAPQPDKPAATMAELPAAPHVKPAATASAEAAPAKSAAVKAASSKAAAVPAKEAAPEPAKAAEAPATTIAQEEVKEAAAAPSSTGIDQFRWPVQGRLLKRYGEKDGARRSDGLDISVPRGTPVKAAENGVVIYAGDGLKEFGNTVLVRHDNGLVTVYGHADDLKVKRGETVKRGQEIATAGMSGDAASPMLHFEVRKNSAPVDPGKYLQ